MASDRGVVYMEPGKVEVQTIDFPKLVIAKAVTVQVMPLDKAPQGYQAVDKGAAKKFVIALHGSLK